MYLPYLRGKQYELIAVRELSEHLSNDIFRPIIEPVRRNFSPLFKAIISLNNADISPIIIINPSVGELQNSSLELLQQLDDYDYLPCIVVTGGDMATAAEIVRHINRPFAVQITGGISNEVISFSKDAEVTIVDHGTSELVVNQLTNVVLYGDFFKKKRRNADYPSESSFSHLHATSNALGFSDHTVIPREYSESGGPAYVVTIHLSYIDENRFDELYVKHYSSTDNGSPTDPAGKFIEALDKAMHDYQNGVFFDSSGMKELKKLHNNTHYAGLGLVKKLSIKHHVETVCDYIAR
ncbi:TPA: sce7725 family protein [Vibrio parahaemolyticus]|uniref:sce7725 family protein n=2 Tax=Vibrio parahaemolyticus TaxID=670 RepID=UPI000A3B99D1|nr:sce7725 family protein [Vibrio parahaemolyticus]MBE3988399.1 sce7725 family protein [Vibrio parahaemolyticus]MDF5660028.1 sce7725 family protein [Vibrio parahaemolyticus]MEA5355856.1 sce7725 family protein [Vibrio parahaemolyticus]OUJ31760.1 hypothetical protein BTR13_06915 [Vibrio parahaemolyticus]HCG6616790.1 sce7725 family protein [Vibrio parahaemolyticus]